MLGVLSLTISTRMVLVKKVGLLAKLLDSQGETKSADAFLQRMLHNYQDINEDEVVMVSEKESCSC
jgi:hypothetical protein